MFLINSAFTDDEEDRKQIRQIDYDQIPFIHTIPKSKPWIKDRSTALGKAEIEHLTRMGLINAQLYGPNITQAAYVYQAIFNHPRGLLTTSNTYIYELLYKVKILDNRELGSLVRSIYMIPNSIQVGAEWAQMLDYTKMGVDMELWVHETYVPKEMVLFEEESYLSKKSDVQGTQNIVESFQVEYDRRKANNAAFFYYLESSKKFSESKTYAVKLKNNKTGYITNALDVQEWFDYTAKITADEIVEVNTQKEYALPIWEGGQRKLRYSHYGYVCSQKTYVIICIGGSPGTWMTNYREWLDRKLVIIIDKVKPDPRIGNFIWINDYITRSNLAKITNKIEFEIKQFAKLKKMSLSKVQSGTLVIDDIRTPRNGEDWNEWNKIVDDNQTLSTEIAKYFHLHFRAGRFIIKFRPVYNKIKFKHLKGQLNFQPFSKLTSHELRLHVTGVPTVVEYFTNEIVTIVNQYNTKRFKSLGDLDVSRVIILGMNGFCRVVKTEEVYQDTSSNKIGLFSLSNIENHSYSNRLYREVLLKRLIFTVVHMSYQTDNAITLGYKKNYFDMTIDLYSEVLMKDVFIVPLKDVLSRLGTEVINPLCFKTSVVTYVDPGDAQDVSRIAKDVKIVTNYYRTCIFNHDPLQWYQLREDALKEVVKTFDLKVKGFKILKNGKYSWVDKDGKIRYGEVSGHAIAYLCSYELGLNFGVMKYIREIKLNLRTGRAGVEYKNISHATKWHTNFEWYVGFYLGGKIVRNRICTRVTNDVLVRWDLGVEFVLKQFDDFSKSFS